MRRRSIIVYAEKGVTEYQALQAAVTHGLDKEHLVMSGEGLLRVAGRGRRPMLIEIMVTSSSGLPSDMSSSIRVGLSKEASSRRRRQRQHMNVKMVVQKPWGHPWFSRHVISLVERYYPGWQVEGYALVRGGRRA